MQAKNVQFFLTILTPFFRKKVHLFSGHVADIMHTLTYIAFIICKLWSKIVQNKQPMSLKLTNKNVQFFLN